MTIDELKQQLARFRIRLTKRLGQNFLLSDEVFDEIVRAAELKPADVVLEIGPGLSFLTKRLAHKAKTILAVEKDRRLVKVLTKLFKGNKNVNIISRDILSFSPDVELADTKYKVVGNIPYYLTGKLLQNFLSGRIENRPSLMILMLQKEVAERLVAEPGQLSILGVTAQLFSDIDFIRTVDRSSFYPKPGVDSALVRFRVLDQPRLSVDTEKFIQLVKVGFANKRKQLHNNLQSLPKRGKKPLDYKNILESCGLSPLCRAQDLSLTDWEKLYLTIEHNL